VANAGTQKGDRAGSAFSGLHLGEGDAGVIVDRHEQVPTDTIGIVARIASNTMTHALNTAQFLGIDMQQIVDFLRACLQSSSPRHPTSRRLDSREGVQCRWQRSATHGVLHSAMSG